jgi:acetoin utilization protein AcuB
MLRSRPAGGATHARPRPDAGETSMTKKVAKKKAGSTRTAKGTGKTAARARKPKRAAPLVSAFMTRSPHTIGRDQTLARAHELMNKHRIRHLPVLAGGRLVGLLSQRDLYFVESLDDTAADRIKVEEAMTQEVFATAPDTPLGDVISTMVRKKHGCAVVMQGGQVAGVLSTIDGLKALLTYLPS